MAKKAKKSFVLRMDQEMFDQIQRWADDEFRSVNGQVEFVLNEALKKAGRKTKKKNDE